METGIPQSPGTSWPTHHRWRRDGRTRCRSEEKGLIVAMEHRPDRSLERSRLSFRGGMASSSLRRWQCAPTPPRRTVAETSNVHVVAQGAPTGTRMEIIEPDNNVMVPLASGSAVGRDVCMDSRAVAGQRDGSTVAWGPASSHGQARPVPLVSALAGFRRRSD